MSHRFFPSRAEPLPAPPAAGPPVTSVEVHGERPDVLVLGVCAALVALLGVGLFSAAEGVVKSNGDGIFAGLVFGAVPAGLLGYVWLRHREAWTRWTLLEEGILIQRGSLDDETGRLELPWSEVWGYRVHPGPPLAPERLTLLGGPPGVVLWHGRGGDRREFTGFVWALCARVDALRSGRGAPAELPVEHGLNPVSGGMLIGAVAALLLQLAGVAAVGLVGRRDRRLPGAAAGHRPGALGLGAGAPPSPWRRRARLPSFPRERSRRMSNELHEQNRLSWNEATRAHNSHKGDQAAWLRAGGDTLFPEELALLGEVAGRSLLHLQCNAGQDSLCLARRGARVTGVDISDEAVEFARRLSAETGIAAEFARADVYDWLAEAARAGRRFDRVFSSYGAVCWLSDLPAWARGIAGVLAPGGRFALVEFHPVAAMFDEELRLRYPYACAGEPLAWDDGVGDYVARSGEGLLHGAEYQAGVVDFRNPQPSYEFFWGLGDVVGALLGAGLVLETLREYPYSNGCTFYPGMRTDDGRRFRLPEGVPEFPLMYGVAARAPG